MKFKSLLIALALASCSPNAYAQIANGKVTTAAPTYTNGATSPLSIETDGDLRTSGEAVIVGNVTVDQGTSPWIIDGDVDVLTLPAIPAGNNNIGDVDAIQSGAWNVGLNAGTNNIGDVDVLTLPAIPAGNNNIGDVDVATLPTLANVTTVGTVTTVTGATVIPATTTAGTSNFSLISLASTNANAIKGGAGTVFELSMYNNSATIAYLKLYNATSQTCGTGTPVARYLIPASTAGAGSNVVIPLGKSFATGIAMCLTTGIADADTGAVAASAYLINVTYK